MHALIKLIALAGFVLPLAGAQANQTTNHIEYDEPFHGRSANVAPVPINREGWSIHSSCESEQENGISNLIDGNSGTYWHTDNAPSSSSLPFNITIDMKQVELVSAMTYTPRPDSPPNSCIGRHEVYLSLDGQQWGSPVSKGTWADDATVKTSKFGQASARYLRMTIYPGTATGSGLRKRQNVGDQASGADVAVLKAPRSNLARNSWRVSADSSQPGPSYNPPQNAIDGATTTIWHTQFSGNVPPLPHYFTIDQGAAIAVAGLSYLPRPASVANGRIGRYQIQYSSNGNSWTNANAGTWADNDQLKYVEFAPVTARYWRLVALSEAGNRGPWTSAAEINLLDGRIGGGNWRVTVDSEETKAASNVAKNALDRNLQTFWHSQFTPTVAPLPHFFTIDMLANYNIYGLTYTPRQDNMKNGNIGRFRIGVSNDGKTWKNVATGTFIDDQSSKPLFFGDNNARYIRLTALSEAGNRGQWTSAAEITPMFSTGGAVSGAQVGAWGTVIDFPIVPVAVSLLPNNQVLAWSAFRPLQFTETDQRTTDMAYYDMRTGTVSPRIVTNTNHDMFCPGLSTDFNGRPVVTGGNSASMTSIYAPGNAQWFQAAQMRIGRGYQSSTTLSDGRTFTIGGSWSGGTSKKPGEVYNPNTNTWTLLNGCPVEPILTKDAQGLYRSDNHAWLFSWSNGWLFHAGPSRAMNWYSAAGNGQHTAAGQRGNSPDSMNGIAVMYDAVAGKILTAGGAPSYQDSPASTNAHVVTIGRPQIAPQVASTGNMAYGRSFHNGVALPDGSVFIVGGQSWAVPFTDDTAILTPELWSPRTNTFRTLAPHKVARTYHSVAILLPDATVFSGGGGLCGGCDTNHLDAQIYSPPYLFNGDGSRAARPTINSISANKFRVGSKMTINAAGATQFSMIRSGSATHTVNTDQRRIPLTISSQAGGSYVVTIPSDPGVALPGYWMVFALNANGVPSVSKTIQVTP